MRRILLLLVLAGCGSDTDDRPATWEYLHAAIFIPNCATSGCHAALTKTGPSAAIRIDLSDRKAACSTLAGLSDFMPEFGPKQATLYQILTRGGPQGGYDDYRMPPDQPLPDADIDLIVRWIAAGAPCP